MSQADTPVEALAFLYLTFGHAADEQLTADEMRTLAAKLAKRAPELSLEDLGQVLRRTVDAYKACGSREEKIERATGYAAALRDAVDDKMRQAIADDLAAIAEADGDVSQGEKDLLAQISQTLGLEG